MAFVPALDASYSTNIGYILIFNLIVGTGALALPKAFHSAGCLLGVLLLSISAFMSYVCATFVVEGMAIANAVALRNKLRANKERSEKQLLAAYRIRKRVEISGMARLFIGKYGVLLLNIIVAIYLFGDLAVYTVTVPKSIMNIICQSVNASTEHGHNACYDNWPNWLQRIAVYRFTVCLFVCFVTPLVLIGIHRTKFLQLSTSICRWSAFTLMIVLACIQLAREGSPSMPKMFNIHGFGSLFGTTVYAFMCHHSLPSLVTPMKSKRHIFIYLAMVYVLVSIFYLALAITGTFSFSHIFDVYSLNFLHNKTDTLHEILVNYFLALFPVFTLSSNYPIVACTLINNLTVQVDLISELFFSDMKMQFLGSSAMGFNPHYLYRLFTRKGNDSTCLLDDHSDSDPEIVVVDTISKIGRWRHYAIAFVVIASATLIAFCTDNVLILTSITGSYPGVGVQYIIPSIIAIYGRRFSTQNIGAEVPRAVRSPFSSSLWPTAMLIWSAFTVLMVTLESCHAFTYLP